MARYRKLIGCVLAVAASAIPAWATTYTSASYVQDGLIAQWDGIDNVGTGTHDPNATVWKDLAGHNDLTIVAGRGSEWRRGIAFYMNTRAAGLAAAYGTESATTYKTIEILFKETSWWSRILFWGGSQSRYVAFDPRDYNPFKWVYFDGVGGAKRTPYAKVRTFEPNAVVATYDDNNAVTQIYCDGAPRVNATNSNNWSPGDNRVTLGWRSVNTAGVNYGWEGEVYSIRLYSRVLTPEEIARNHAIDVKRFYTTAMYDKDGMVSFWDASENAGEGQHSSTTNIWKNLVAGEQDLTLNNSSWDGNALLCTGVTKSGAYGTTTRTYKSLEVLFRNEKTDANSWLFSNGINQYCVLGTWRTQWYNYYGVYSTLFDRPFSKSYGGMHALSFATSHNLPTNATVYLDGEKMVYEARANPKRDNDLDDWGTGSVVGVGGRSTGTQNFTGRIYATRLYDGELSRERVWQNSKIDRMRYANALWWRGGDGMFETLGNWREVDAAVALPGTDNTVELPLGTYTITLGQDQTVGALRARNGSISYTPRIDATVDMGGHKLTVMGNVEAQGTYGYSSDRFARLSITNGTFQAEEFRLGATSDLIVDRKDAWIGYTSDFTTPFGNGAGSLSVVGPGTTVTIRKDITMAGPFTSLRVAGGATFACKGIRAYAQQDRTSSQDADRDHGRGNDGQHQRPLDPPRRGLHDQRRRDRHHSLQFRILRRGRLLPRLHRAELRGHWRQQHADGRGQRVADAQEHGVRRRRLVQGIGRPRHVDDGAEPRHGDALGNESLLRGRGAVCERKGHQLDELCPERAGRLDVRRGIREGRDRRDRRFFVQRHQRGRFDDVRLQGPLHRIEGKRALQLERLFPRVGRCSARRRDRHGRRLDQAPRGRAAPVHAPGGRFRRHADHDGGRRESRRRRG